MRSKRANLQPGETLLVLGASGGVGLAAVEIGKAMGARVIAAASSAENSPWPRPPAPMS
jgi:NADPH2:quinone reductase